MHPNDTFIYRNLTSLRNGTCYRATGRKRDEQYARYLNGDFTGFVNEVPEGFTASTRKHIKSDLPASLKGS
jgi:hypothetical protein